MTRLAEVWRTKIVHSPSGTSASATADATSRVTSTKPWPRVCTESCLTMVDASPADDDFAVRSARLEIRPVAQHFEPRRHQHHATEAAANASNARRIDFEP